MSDHKSILGAIIGDIAGSTYFGESAKTANVELFAPGSHYCDGTVMTVAVADYLINGGSIYETIRKWGNNRCLRYDVGYGKSFQAWLWADEPKCNISWGCGCAKRVSPVSFYATGPGFVDEYAERVTKPSHWSDEGILWAQLVAMAIRWSIMGMPKEEMKHKLEMFKGVDLNETCDEIRKRYRLDPSARATCPVAIRAFLESNDYEDALRLAISLGGDCVSTACITGSIAGAYYGVPAELEQKVMEMLPEEIQQVITKFNELAKPRTEATMRIGKSIYSQNND